MLQAGNITINFTSNYPTHRICYRLSTDPPGVYNVIDPLTPPCGSGGVPCGYSIPVNLDNDTCTTITYEGYVQATCQPLYTSPGVYNMVGAIPWTCTFTPSEACYSEKITCASVTAKDIIVTNGGSGYSLVSPPPAITWNTGSAHANAYVADDGVMGVSIFDPGAAYTPGVYTVGQASTTGIGTGAVFTITVNSSGVISAATVALPLHSNIGSGYQAGDHITLSAFGSGNRGVLDVTSLYATGIVYECSIDVNDTFSVIPLITIAPPVSGVQATGTVEVNPCSTFNKVQCNGSASTVSIQLELGEQLVTCGQHGSYPATEVPVDYTQIHAGCCYTCHELRFVPVTGTPTVTCLDCVDGIWKSYALNIIPLVVCVTDGAYFFTPADANVIVTEGAVCPIV